MIVATNLEYDNSFSVLPKHCNWQMSRMEGGVLMSQLDLCAVEAVSRLLHDSECDAADIYKSNFTFHAPAELGDLIFMKATIVELRTKAVRVIMAAYRERRTRAGKELIAEAEFIFCSKINGKFRPHGLEMPKL